MLHTKTLQASYLEMTRRKLNPWYVVFSDILSQF